MELELGPHLLGRKPSPPDERDWRLADFLVDDGSLRDQAVAELRQTVVGYRQILAPPPPSGSHWAKALALLNQIGGTPAPPATTSVLWPDAEPVLDQGNFGTCVGNGWAQWGNTLPIDDSYDEAAARAIYYESTIIGGSADDPDAPGGGQQGSTVRDGAKAMQKRGRLGSYAFAASVDELRKYVRTSGPGVVGTDWTTDMFSPDERGFVYPTGSVEGGHCYLCDEDDPDRGALGFLNSWGDWGLGGRFYIRYEDFGKLFGAGGEACVALELPL